MRVCCLDGLDYSTSSALNQRLNPLLHNERRSKFMAIRALWVFLPRLIRLYSSHGQYYRFDQV